VGPPSTEPDAPPEGMLPAFLSLFLFLISACQRETRGKYSRVHVPIPQSNDQPYNESDNTQRKDDSNDQQLLPPASFRNMFIVGHTSPQLCQLLPLLSIQRSLINRRPIWWRTSLMIEPRRPAERKMFIGRTIRGARRNWRSWRSLSRRNKGCVVFGDGWQRAGRCAVARMRSDLRGGLHGEDESHVEDVEGYFRRWEGWPCARHINWVAAAVRRLTYGTGNQDRWAVDL